MQRADESVRDFGTDVMRLTRIAYPTWPEVAIQTTARRTFVAGLQSAEMRRQLRLHPTESFSETLQAALHVEAVDAQEPPSKRARVHVNQIAPQVAAEAVPQEDAGQNATVETRRVAAQPSTSGASSTDQRLQELVAELSKLVKSLAPRDRAGPRLRSCFECGSTDHLVRECPEARRRDQRNNGSGSGRHSERDRHDRHGGHRRDDKEGSKGHRGDSRTKDSGNAA